MPCGWTIKRLFLYTIRYFFTLQNWRISLHDDESFCSIKSFVCFVVLFVSQIILPNKNFLLLGDQKNLFLTSNSNLLTKYFFRRNTFYKDVTKRHAYRKVTIWQIETTRYELSFSQMLRLENLASRRITFTTCIQDDRMFELTYLMLV